MLTHRKLIKVNKYIWIWFIIIFLSGCAQAPKTTNDKTTGEEQDYAYIPKKWNLNEDIELTRELTIAGDTIYYLGKFYYDEETGEMQQSVYSLPTILPTDGIIKEEIFINSAEHNGFIIKLFTDENDNFACLSIIAQTENESAQYLIRSFDSTGNLIAETNITNGIMQSGKINLESDEFESPSLITRDSNGSLYLKYEVGTNTTIIILDNEGNYEKKLLFSDSSIESMSNASDGNIYVVENKNEKCNISVIKKGKLNQVFTVPYSKGVGRLALDKNDLIAYSNNEKLYIYNTNETEGNELLEWPEYGLNGRDIIKFFSLANEQYIALIKDPNTSSRINIMSLQKTALSDIPQKETVVLGCYKAEDPLKIIVSQFNLDNPFYNVVIKEYSADSSEGMQLMQVEIATGSGPDLIPLSSIDNKEYVKKGILEDLTPYLNNSEILSADMLVDSVIRNNTMNGILYCLPPTFTINAMAGRVTDIGSSMGWTFEEFKEYVLANNGKQLFQGRVDGGQSQGLIIMLDYWAQPDKYVDWNTHTAYFDSPAFIDLLNFARQYQLKYYDSTKSIESKIQDRDVLLWIFGLSDVTDYLLNKVMFEGDINYIGYPTESGTTLHGLSNIYAYGIRSNSESKKGAWTFIEYMISKQKGNNSIYSAFPTMKSALEEMFNNSMEKSTSLDSLGTPYEVPKLVFGDYAVYAATQEDIEEIKYLIDNATFISDTGTFIESIIFEETELFFNENKSAEETAKVIQNRVQLYLNEIK